MAGAHEVQGARVVDLSAHRQARDRRQTLEPATTREDSPGWLLRSPAYRVVDNLVPWAGLADGGSFAALLGDPIDAYLIRTTFPAAALARSFCGGPTLEQVTLAVMQDPRRVKARVWVGGYGTPGEGVSVAAVYVRFEGDPGDADARAGRHPALWAWLADRLGQDGAGPSWPEPDEIAPDRTDVRETGSWWRLRWGPSRTPHVRGSRVPPPHAVPRASGASGPRAGS
ncbi:hypothetical protein [Promicromonospora iranensis]|uniref:Uncharacterized protein n=1 Tax=Promicromonospora iranensis TaxID=1105144 RepID=A0ABU2CQ09_9MICO|nr:hypothetical protein [Promicromonospora iranensis]MDR7383415.1 hypothetical protein [Promicromonospora iranensis]